MDGKNRLLTEFGKQILEEMEPLAEIIDSRNKEYSSALSRMQSRVNSPEETPSSQILDQMISSKLDLLDFGSTIAKHNRDHYKKINQAKSLDKSYLYTEVKRSIEEQTTLESKSEGLIEDFIKHYFNN